MSDRVTQIERLLEAQRLNSKVLTYKSIDAESRSMRNNIVIYGLTERLKGNCTHLVLNFISDELDIDTSDMHIERAHRMGRFDPKSRDAKRPMVVRLRDYVDTETIMENT
ncbi:hypothetical protein DPMN_088075 [Dreissena polymorpha]|uniref:Uncharacterized protein n=1 Tax=Dreissena polymorpha TaxID=45954 RepID=A0A9D4KVJ5_DREPO|nr:hypothetical protein DPMN_088075 [Dreissena polymorpha]